MKPTLAGNALARQDEHVTPTTEPQGESVSLARILRQAIDFKRWKHDAIAAAIKVPPRYFSRQLAGEKPITAKHLRLLPRDVEIEFLRRWCAALGVLVIESVSEEEARQQLATGLFSLLLAKPTATSSTPAAPFVERRRAAVSA